MMLNLFASLFGLTLELEGKEWNLNQFKFNLPKGVEDSERWKREVSFFLFLRPDPFLEVQIGWLSVLETFDWSLNMWRLGEADTSPV